MVMEKKEANKAQVSQDEKKKQKIYIGPTMRGMVSGTVLTNGFPPAFLEASKGCPALMELVVPVSRLPQANRELAVFDSALSRFYRIAMEYKKGV
ncbi:MAG: hypothetical protein HFG49_08360 [Lachnospiraceae bacterium]|jgi:hypothetical protein|nr:hypothetical protein [Lachnospiraceae bacterium]